MVVAATKAARAPERLWPVPLHPTVALPWVRELLWLARELLWLARDSLRPAWVSSLAEAALRALVRTCSSPPLV